MRMNINTNAEVFDVEQVISKCGNYCGTCPWGCYQRARISEDGWESYRDDAKKYVGFTPTAKPCQACQTPNEKLAKDVGVHNFVRGCLARECATYNEIQNCAYCSRYPCDWIEAHVGEISRESTSERLGEPVPDEAYEQFIEPFQGKAHLDVIRASLSPNDIVESKTVKIPVKKIVDYPEKAKLAFKEMHRQVGDLLLDEKGIALKGLLVRHLVLPQGLAGTQDVMHFLAQEISKNTYVNIMDQFYPRGKISANSPLSKGITQAEFSEAIEAAKNEGITRLDKREKLRLIWPF